MSRPQLTLSTNFPLSPETARLRAKTRRRQELQRRRKVKARQAALRVLAAPVTPPPLSEADRALLARLSKTLG